MQYEQWNWELVSDGGQSGPDRPHTCQIGTQKQTFREMVISWKKDGASLVHLGVEGPNSVAQMHSCIKEHFHIEQIVNT